MNSEPVFAWRKNGREEVRAFLGEYEGTPTANVRVFYQARSGDWLPSKKGISVSVEQLPELEEAVRRLRASVSR